MVAWYNEISARYPVQQVSNSFRAECSSRLIGWSERISVSSTMQWNRAMVGLKETEGAVVESNEGSLVVGTNVVRIASIEGNRSLCS